MEKDLMKLEAEHSAWMNLFQHQTLSTQLHQDLNTAQLIGLYDSHKITTPGLREKWVTFYFFSP